MQESSKQYQLEKFLWSNADFEQMGWDDCRIFAISFGENFTLLFDIDYIFTWTQTAETYQYWVSPCTLMFENVHDIEFQLEGITGGLDIIRIDRENSQKPQNSQFLTVDRDFDWTIETQQGSVFFKSIGYKQYVRQSPKIISGQYFGLLERGGISFDVTII